MDRSDRIAAARRQQRNARQKLRREGVLAVASPRPVVLALPSETKYFDTSIAATVTWAGTSWASSEVPCENYVNASGTAAAYTDAALIPSAVGSGYGQVVGNRYRFKKLRVRGILSTAVDSDQADVAAPVQCRMILVHDTQPNGAQAQGEDVMQDIGGANANISSFKRVADTSGRFRIVKDEWVTLQPATSGTDGANTVSTSRTGAYVSMQYQPKMPITCNIKAGNSTPTVAGLVDNNFFLLLAGTKSTDGTAVSINFLGASRAYYCE